MVQDFCYIIGSYDVIGCYKLVVSLCELVNTVHDDVGARYRLNEMRFSYIPERSPEANLIKKIQVASSPHLFVESAAVSNLPASRCVPECLFIFPCQWNYRPDHCMYGSNCKGAEDEGVSILHGNRGVYHDNKQPAFKVVYDAIRDVSGATRKGIVAQTLTSWGL